ncbi:MAG: isoprenylcysteine carboxylmethyltransferase family protein, partial [Gemmatimonadetes bacterium]|nr:isoprenylcysteine carboxylmethyltransferase family protein [Gemmatimonadota bacterium]
MTDLSKRALGRTASFLIVLAALLFGAAGSLGYWRGWSWWGLFAAGVLANTLYF